MSEAIDRLRALTEELATQGLQAAIIEDLPDALVIVDDHGSIVSFNKQAGLLFGYHRSEVLGSPIHLLLPERFRESHAQHISAYMQNPRSRPMGQHFQTLTGLYKTGAEFPVAINLQPHQTPSGLVVVAVIRKEKG